MHRIRQGIYGRLLNYRAEIRDREIGNSEIWSLEIEQTRQLKAEIRNLSLDLGDLDPQDLMSPKRFDMASLNDRLDPGSVIPLRYGSPRSNEIFLISALS
jgi:hypothetical protein